MLSEKYVGIETELYEKKRELEVQNIEISSLKSKCQKYDALFRKYEIENRDMRVQVMKGVEDNTNLYKSHVQEQSKSNSMRIKVEGLEQGLLTLSDG